MNIPVDSIAITLRSQYRAALAMMEQSISLCPEDNWDDAGDGNRFWHLAYHTLFYVALYTSSENDPVLWPKCREHHQFLSKAQRAPEYEPSAAEPYSKSELLEFVQWIWQRLDVCFNDASPGLPSQFSWISFSRLDLHIYNLRHLQHHCGQLSERVKRATGVGVSWVGRG